MRDPSEELSVRLGSKLQHGLVMYDALYAWCKHVRDERHNWNPQRRA